MFQKFDPMDLSMNVFKKIGSEWFLVSAGNKEKFNMMTASWGMVGILWNKPVTATFIRPQRYTKEFVDSNETYALSFFGEGQREALKFCGSKSGRDYDKAKETGLTPVELDDTIAFEEAELVLLCKKLYVDEITEKCFLDSALVEKNYAAKDFHQVYLSEIVAAYKKM